MHHTSSQQQEHLSRAISDWYRDNRRDLPWRREGFSAWGTLVSEFMLQQTPVARVVPRLKHWLERWPTPADLAAASPADAIRLWDNLGYPRRALWLHRAATEITDRFDGAVPSDVDQLLQLTGVGDYTARAVAVFAYGQRHPVVDTNVRRVVARALLGQAEPGAPHRRDLTDMVRLLPADSEESALVSAAVMELGALICTSKKPACNSCPIRDRCSWAQAGFPPDKGPRRSVQKKFIGSDRQIRGLVLRQLRSHTGPSSMLSLKTLCEDAGQFTRVITSLLADGLIVEHLDGFALPTHQHEFVD